MEISLAYAHHSHNLVAWELIIFRLMRFTVSYTHWEYNNTG